MNPLEPIIGILEASDDEFINSDMEEELGVIKRKESEGKQENDKESSDDSDASIERLINLKNIGRKRVNDEGYYTAKPTKKPDKKKIDILELVNGADDPSDEDSEEEELPRILTEAEYIKKINEDCKRQLLESDSSEPSDDEDEISVASEAKDTESDGSSDSDSSLLMNRFLASFDENQKSINKKEKYKPASIDSGVDEKPSPKSTNRRKSSVDNEVDFQQI